MADQNVKFSLHPMLLLLYCNLSGLPVSSVFQLHRKQGQFYSQNPRLVVCRRLKKCHDTLFRLTNGLLTVSVRPISPCHPLSGIDRTYFFLPLESLPDLLHGFSFGDSQISGTWTHFRLQAPH